MGEVIFHNAAGKESDIQKKALEELTLQSLKDKDKEHLFVHDGDYTLMLVNGSLQLCIGSPDKCGTNNSLRNNACTYVVLTTDPRGQYWFFQNYLATHAIH